MDQMSKEDLLKLVLTYASAIVALAEKLEQPDLKPLPQDELVYVGMLKDSANIIVRASQIAGN